MKLFTVFDPEEHGPAIVSSIVKRDKILIDNLAFYLHYHVTSWIFFIGCLLVTIGMYVMDPIDCIADSSVMDVIDNYCLYHSTHTISGVGDSGEGPAPHPGIPPKPSAADYENVRLHQYYLWVAIVLALQALTFYLPRCFWELWEGKRVFMMLKEKKKLFRKIMEEDEQKEIDGGGGGGGGSGKEETHPLILYLLSGHHWPYYCKLLGCEILNFVNVILQLALTNAFFGYGLQTLGLDFLQLLKEVRPSERSDLVNQMFPKVTKCVFYSYGPGGNVQNYEALCVLPVNAVNEKIFILICIWLLILASISALAIAYRILFLVPSFRKGILRIHLQDGEDIYSQLKTLGDKMKIGSWMLLCQLCGNHKVDSWEITKIVEFLAKGLDKHHLE